MSIDSRLRKKLAELAFVLDETNSRYHQERDKRLRDRGRREPMAPSAAPSHLVDDRSAAPIVPRAPIEGERGVVIIGAGFGGLLAGVRLHEAGFDDLCIIDEAGDFGGTWYWNRFPGAQCDVESYVYLPLLEETNYIPTEKYASQDEIFAHVQRIAHHYDLYRHACFHTKVEEMRWSEPEGRWTVLTNRGDRIKAQHVIISPGPLNRPNCRALRALGTSRDISFTRADGTMTIPAAIQKIRF